MGSYNEIDAITQLPIVAGDKCRVFVLVKGENGDWSVADKAYYPRGVAVKGTYDDYGVLTNIKEDINTNILLDNIKDNWITTPECGHKSAFKSKDLTIHSLIENVAMPNGYENNFIKDGRNNEIRPLYLMFVLEDVYKEMIDFEPYYYSYKLKKNILIKDDLKDWYNIGLKIAAKLENKNRLLNEIAMHCISGNENYFNVLSHDYYGCHGISYYHDYLFECMKNNVRYTDPNVKKVCNALSEHAVFLKSMMSARKVFQPQFAQGSQMTPTGVYKAINNAQNKIIARLDKKNKGIII